MQVGPEETEVAQVDDALDGNAQLLLRVFDLLVDDFVIAVGVRNNQDHVSVKLLPGGR